MLGLLLGLLTMGLGLGPASASDTPSASGSSGLRAGGTEQTTERASDESEAPAGKTVVFGVPGLTMNDIDRERTPNLYRLLSDGAAANLNVRTIGSATCPASGWLSFGAGARAQAGPSPAAEAADEDNAARCPAMLAPTTDVDSDALDSDDAATEAADEDEAGRKSDEAHAQSSVAGATTGR